MNTSDTLITFNVNGVCIHCQEFDSIISKTWFPNQEGENKLNKIYDELKIKSKENEYDCILGLSGGIDSSYLALKIYDANLKPLVVHVDGGWNTELAVQNIENIINYCGWHLHTVVIDWEEMKDLQLAYLKSSISNQDVPQDHAFFASLYHFAVKHNINTIISGGNIATECISPKSWHGSAMDAINLKAIHKKFGQKKLKNYKTISFFNLYFYYPFIKKMTTIRPLNFMQYVKSEALQELKDRVGYKEYARKHGESIFSKFFQNYYLPKKFGYDKRIMHYSSMIVTGQMTRSEAVEELSKPLYDDKELFDDKEYIAKKLGITNEEFEIILKNKIHNYLDFPNFLSRYKFIKNIQQFISNKFGIKITKYS
jgi:N-acetyl sugar amidotransferase